VQTKLDKTTRRIGFEPAKVRDLLHCCGNELTFMADVAGDPTGGARMLYEVAR